VIMYYYYQCHTLGDHVLCISMSHTRSCTININVTNSAMYY